MSIDPFTAAFDLGKAAIERIWPDATTRATEIRKLEELRQAGSLAALNAQVTLMCKQAEINMKEADHPSLFVAGWRPAVGWTGAAAFAYMSIVEPVARFIATMTGYDGEFPVIDSDITVQVLLGMLGLGIMRSFDKREKSDTKRMK